MAHLRGEQVNAHSQSSIERAVVDSDENNYFISGIFLSSSPSDVRAWEFLNYCFHSTSFTRERRRQKN